MCYYCKLSNILSGLPDNTCKPDDMVDEHLDYFYKMAFDCFRDISFDEFKKLGQQILFHIEIPRLARFAHYFDCNYDIYFTNLIHHNMSMLSQEQWDSYLLVTETSKLLKQMYFDLIWDLFFSKEQLDEHTIDHIFRRVATSTPMIIDIFIDTYLIPLTFGSRLHKLGRIFGILCHANDTVMLSSVWPKWEDQITIQDKRLLLVVASTYSSIDVVRYLYNIFKENQFEVLDETTVSCCLQHAVSNGCLDIFECLTRDNTFDRSILDKNHTFVFMSIIHTANLELLLYIEQYFVDELCTLIPQNDYACLKVICQGGVTDKSQTTRIWNIITKYITPDIIQQVLRSSNYTPIQLLFSRQELGILQNLSDKYPQLLQEAIEMNGTYQIINQLCQNGLKDMFLYVLQFLEDRGAPFPETQIDTAFYSACNFWFYLDRIHQNFGGYEIEQQNKIGVLKILIEKYPIKVKEAVQCQEYLCFRTACATNCFMIANFLLWEFKEFAQQMIASCSNLFQTVCANGDLNMFITLLGYSSNPEQLYAKDNFAAFRYACMNNQSHIVRELLRRFCRHRFDAIKHDDYAVFRDSCKLGYLQVVETIIEEIEDTGRGKGFLLEMNRALDYQGFRYAVLNHQMLVATYLIDRFAMQNTEMFRAQEYGAFRFACRFGLLTMVKMLFSKAPTTLKGHMISLGYTCAQKHWHDDIMQFLTTCGEYGCK